MTDWRPIPVSTHAIRRYMERIAGFGAECYAAEAQLAKAGKLVTDDNVLSIVLADMKVTREDIAAHICPPEIRAALEGGAARIRLPDMVLCAKQGIISTVYSTEKPSDDD